MTINSAFRTKVIDLHLSGQGLALLMKTIHYFLVGFVISLL